MTWYLRALAVLLICSAVAEVAWKEGRGKSYADALELYHARRNLQMRVEVDSLALAHVKAQDDSIILDYQDALDRLVKEVQQIKCN